MRGGNKAGTAVKGDWYIFRKKVKNYFKNGFFSGLSFQDATMTFQFVFNTGHQLQHSVKKL
jgi:hypothetical protein